MTTTALGHSSSLLARARGWSASNTWMPSWQPARLRRGIFAYVLAIAVVTTAVALTAVAERSFPRYAFHGMLGMLALLGVAMIWGPGPGVFSALYNAMALTFVVTSSTRASALPRVPTFVSDLVVFLLSLSFGLAVALVAGLSESRRRRLLGEQATRERLLVQTAETLRRLQAVHAVTDPSLTQLPAQDLLRQLVTRVAQVLDADDAALLLITEDGRSLVVYMAYGFEKRQEGEVLVPIGEGIAGRIAASRQPLVLDDFRCADVSNQQLLRSVRSLAGVPVMVQDRLLGVLHADSTSPRRFSAEDLEILQLVAERIGLVIENASLQAEERQRVTDLAVERDRLERILAALPVGVIVYDADSCLTEVNGAARQLIGVERSAAIVGERHDDVADRIFGQDANLSRPGGVPPLHGHHFGGEIRDEQLIVRNAGTGRDAPVLVSCTPLNDVAGMIVGAVTVLQDISTLRDLERQRDHLLETVTHDLRNPLTGISGMSQLLQLQIEHVDEHVRERFARSLRSIESAAARMTAQIAELLDYAQTQTGRPPALALEPTDVVGLVRRVLEEHRLSTDRHTLELHVTDEVIMTQVDARRLERAIANLVVNAIKYSPQGGPVVVSVERAVGPDGQWLSIQVSDSGLGIPKTDLPHMFEPYYRASNVASTISGTGIGLAGERNVVQKHGGTVTLDSAEGVGTTVTVRLSMHPDTGAQAGAVS